ncbi:hypothetical protein V5799_000182 [Amblyomma americanum]|uniref:Secreted protein n=1 Tax=Amblyomma americanum TaxID=6943 RepID=A0AAQ4D3S6_AMBAM
MKFAVLFLSVLCTLIVATESGPSKWPPAFRLPRRLYCPAWCAVGSKVGSRCEEDCVEKGVVGHFLCFDSSHAVNFKPSEEA